MMSDNHQNTRVDEEEKASDYNEKGQPMLMVALTILVVIAALWTLADFLPSLVWAVVFAVGTWPLYQRLQACMPSSLHGTLPSITATFLVSIIFILPLTLAAVQIGIGLNASVKIVQDARHFGLPVPLWLTSAPLVGVAGADWWKSHLSNPDVVSELLGRFNGESILWFGRNIGGQVVHVIIAFIFTLLALFFLYKDGLFIHSQVLIAANRALGVRGEVICSQITSSIRGTVNGLVLVGLAEGVIIGIAYIIAGVPNAIVFGAITAIAAIIPFAAPLVFIVAAGILFVEGHEISSIFILVFSFIVIFVADHLIRPALIGGATKLPFLWTLFGILGGVEAWGLLGLFVGPAIMTVSVLLWREWISSNKISIHD
jgi:predicted PurR-regulated permease PerM